MRFFVWLVRAFIFFSLFAFALNNLHKAKVRWFFGVEWQAPLVFVVLAAFTAGCVIGVLAMVPSWWRQRRDALRLAPDAAPSAAPAASAANSVTSTLDHPPRDGL